MIVPTKDLYCSEGGFDPDLRSNVEQNDTDDVDELEDT